MAERRLDEIDPNLKVDTDIGEEDVYFYNVLEDPFEIYGLYRAREDRNFKRLPEEIANNTNEGVVKLNWNTAGGRIRFSTNSRYVAIKIIGTSKSIYPHFAPSGQVGADLFIDDPKTESSYFCYPFLPKMEELGSISGKVAFDDRRTRYFTLNLPNYSQMDALYIGLQKDATIDRGMPYRDELPIVYYGSSITQGGCASRPGNAYTHVVGRRLNMNFINLGFSGSGKGEDAIVDYMAKLPMSIFVSDYDHNAPTAEHLKATHLKLYQKIRAEHPDIPYIMLSKPDLNGKSQYLAHKHGLDRRNVIYETYLYALEHGDRNVYYIDGESLFRGPYEDMCTVDRCHPNDLGFALMADAVTATIKRIFTQNKYFIKEAD